MICKYCNAEVPFGGKCPKCGKTYVLADRSRELDRLMKSAEVQIDPLPFQWEPPHPIKDDPVPKPLPRTVFLSLTTLFIILCVGTGILSYHHGYLNGRDTGYAQGAESVENQKGEFYAEGVEAGRAAVLQEMETEKATLRNIQVLYSEEVGRRSPSESVKDIQIILNIMLKSGLKVDGKYGKKTEDTVQQFQQIVGLANTGEIDRETLFQIHYYVDHPELFNNLTSDTGISLDNQDVSDSENGEVSPGNEGGGNVGSNGI